MCIVTMINSEDFVKRLEVLLDYYSISASAFADKIGVQRSSLSHLLSGRNKPSLDFILKIIEAFPEVDLHWLISGKGDFADNKQPQDESTHIFVAAPASPPQAKPAENLDLFSVNEEPKTDNKVSDKITPVEEQVQPGRKADKTIEIDKIVIFYKDGTFKSYISGT
jgi:transcriptional regulator with XRE-family HTH domain